MQAVGEDDFGVAHVSGEDFHLAGPDGVEEVEVAAVEARHAVDGHLHRVEVLAVVALAVPMQLVVGDVVLHRGPYAEGVDDLVGHGVDGHGVGVDLDVLDLEFGAAEGHHAHCLGARGDVARGHGLLGEKGAAADEQGQYGECFLHVRFLCLVPITRDGLRYCAIGGKYFFILCMCVYSLKNIVYLCKMIFQKQNGITN